MKKKTSELTGAELDYAVAVALGKQPQFMVHSNGHKHCWVQLNTWQPSTDWSQGGPIIESEFITIKTFVQWRNDEIKWLAYQNLDIDDVSDDEWRPEALAQTPLITAMRCFVASKLGEEVEIPEPSLNPTV